MICKKCICNSTMPNWHERFDGCSYCEQYNQLERQYPISETALKKQIQEIKSSREKYAEFDCVIGMSGGCDSSMLAHICIENGLTPMGATFSNGWGREIASHNLKVMSEGLEMPIKTYQMDQKEFDSVCKAFMAASVGEIDAPSDLALVNIMYTAAEEANTKYLLDGHSFRTEGISPIGWWYFDTAFVQDINNKYGTMPLKTLPQLELGKWLRWIDQGYKRPRLLYYVDYNKEDTKKFLADTYGWEWYGEHHGENVFTAFTLGHWIPYKLDRDWRIVPLSALVRSGQMTRDEALKTVADKVGCSPEFVKEVKNRLKLDNLTELLDAPIQPHTHFDTYLPVFKAMQEYFKIKAKEGKVPQSFYEKYCK